MLEANRRAKLLTGQSAQFGEFIFEVFHGILQKGFYFLKSSRICATFFVDFNVEICDL